MRISLPKALEIVGLMAKAGFHMAELGFPAGNDFAKNLIAAAMKQELGGMKIAAFGRTRKPNEGVADCIDVKTILNLGVPQAVIVCKSRLLDVTETLHTSAAENLAMISDTVRYLKEQGVQVYLDLEFALDAYFGRREMGKSMTAYQRKRSRKYFQEVVRAGVKAGADCLVFCDTTGGAGPEEVTAIVEAFVRRHPGVCFGFHGHDNNGLATANSRAALLAGARHIQGTINGYGERCGNANLVTFVPRLQLKDGWSLVSAQALATYTDLSVRTALAFNRQPSDRAPFVGRYAYQTSAGMHAAGEDRLPGAYLDADPEAVGNQRSFVITRQSGVSNVMMVSKKVGMPLNRTQATELLQRFRLQIDGGAYEEGETSFIMACRRVAGKHADFFDVTEYRAESGKIHGRHYAKAEAKVKVGSGEPAHTIAEGKGPVDALLTALKKAVIPVYPAIGEVHLKGYKTVALDVEAEEGKAAVLVVATFSSDEEVWVTAGVSTDSNRAGKMAWDDAMHYFLWRKGNGNCHTG
jgi:2-isopropylmalate synthase